MFKLLVAALQLQHMVHMPICVRRLYDSKHQACNRAKRSKEAAENLSKMSTAGPSPWDQANGKAGDKEL